MPQIPPVEGPQNVTQALDLPTRHYPWLNSLLRMVGGETPGPVFGGSPVEYDPAQEAMGLGGSMGRIVNSPTSPVPNDILSRVLRSFKTPYRRLLTSSKTPDYIIESGDSLLRPGEWGATEHFSPGMGRPEFLQKIGRQPMQGGRITISSTLLHGPNPDENVTHEVFHGLQGMAPPGALGEPLVLSKQAIQGLGKRDPNAIKTMFNELGYPLEDWRHELPAWAAQHMSSHMGPVESPISREEGERFIQQMRQASKPFERLRKQRAFEKTQGMNLAGE